MAQPKNITNENFAKNLSVLMAKCGSTQEVISEDLGIAQSAVSNYLKGRVPRADILMELANYFGADPGQLLEAQGDAIQTTPGHFSSEAATLAADLKQDIWNAEEAIKEAEAALKNGEAALQKCKVSIGVAKLVAWRMESIRKVNSKRSK